MEIPEKEPLPSLPIRDHATEERPQPAESVAPGQPIGNTDSVSLTEDGREFQSAVDRARLIPDIREDRVLQLKRQLEKGTYRVEGNRIAVNMIDETLENNSVIKHIDTKV